MEFAEALSENSRTLRVIKRLGWQQDLSALGTVRAPAELCGRRRKSTGKNRHAVMLCWQNGKLLCWPQTSLDNGF